MIIAIDTSTEWVGIALSDGLQVVGEHIWRSQNYHTVELVPAIDNLLRQTSTPRSSISGVAVATGPGSFTGLRIGMAAAKGIALALNVPLIGIPSLDIIVAAQAPMRRPMITLLQVGRGRYAYRRYTYRKDKWEPEGEIQVADPKTIAATITSPVFVCGEMGAAERQVLGRKWKTARLATGSQSLRRPSVLAELAWKQLKDVKAGHGSDLTPIYVHTLSNVPTV